jgi:RNA polymerase sigma-70 factor (ECF subfamily)
MSTANLTIVHPNEGKSLDDERLDKQILLRATMDRFLASVERRALTMAQIAVSDSDEALDIVQDAMIRLVRKYSARPQDEWRPLFFRILKNRILDHQRHQTVRHRVIAWFSPKNADEPGIDQIATAPGAPALQPDRQVAMADAMERLEDAVQNLPARQQQAFLLRALDGLDVAGTAQVMGCSAGSVKTHYSRAVHALRVILGEHWP